MAQVSDVSLANQGFSAFRTELNNILAALNSMHSGTSRPGSATTGTLWLDTTNAGSNSLTIKFFDGSDDISVATIDTSANTINFIDSTVSLSSPLAITGNSTAGAEIRLPEDTDNGTNYVALKAANSIASNLTLTLPSSDGSSGQAITTDGSGNLSFSTAGVSTGKAIAMALIFG